MHDESMKCRTLVCAKAAESGKTRHWCCQGCDEQDCKSRCDNERHRCNVAIDDHKPRNHEGQPWTEQETKVLLAQYHSLSPKELTKHLPGRTPAAIISKASRLGLTMPRAKKNKQEAGQ